MAIQEFRVKTVRPTKLSDPGQDYSGEMLRAILAVPDHEMQWNHYSALMGPFLPAGNYEEVIYFLPAAFRYLIENREHCNEIIVPLIGFVSLHAKDLNDDGYFEIVQDCLREYLEALNGDFVLVHEKRDASVQNETSPSFFSYIMNVDVFSSVISDIVRYKTHIVLAEDMIHNLADHGSDAGKAAKYLAFAADNRGFLGDLRHAQESVVIAKLIFDADRLKKAASLVQQDLISDELARRFWQQTFRVLNIQWN